MELLQEVHQFINVAVGPVFVRELTLSMFLQLLQKEVMCFSASWFGVPTDECKSENRKTGKSSSSAI